MTSKIVLLVYDDDDLREALVERLALYGKLCFCKQTLLQAAHIK